MARESYAFRVAGIEPRDPAFRTAGDDARQAFWRAAVPWVEEAMDRQLAAGKDRHGKPLVPIAESTRRKGRWRSHTGKGTADNPPLTPANALSRTRSLFDARAHWREGYILGFWRFDPASGRHWGQILGFHRAGAGYLPIRDVIGLSPASTAAVRAKGDAWWRDYQRGRHAAAEAEAFTVRVPAAIGRPKPAMTGRVDLHNFTFGIGQDKAFVERAVAEGSFTGFRQLPPRPPTGGGKATPLPMPKPSGGRSPGRIAAGPDRPDYSRRPRPRRPKRKG